MVIDFLYLLDIVIREIVYQQPANICLQNFVKLDNNMSKVSHTSTAWLYKHDLITYILCHKINYKMLQLIVIRCYVTFIIPD